MNFLFHKKTLSKYLFTFKLVLNMKKHFIFIIFSLFFFQNCKDKSIDSDVVNIKVGRIKLQIPSIISHSNFVEYSDYNSDIDGYETYEFKTGKDTGEIQIQSRIKGNSNTAPIDSILFSEMKQQIRSEHREIKEFRTEIRTILNYKMDVLYFNSGFYIRIIIDERPYRIRLNNVSDLKLQNQIIQSIQINP